MRFNTSLKGGRYESNHHYNRFYNVVLCTRYYKSVNTSFFLLFKQQFVIVVFSLWVSCPSWKRSACSRRLRTRPSLPSCMRTIRASTRTSASQNRARRRSMSRTLRCTTTPARWATALWAVLDLFQYDSIQCECIAVSPPLCYIVDRILSNTQKLFAYLQSTQCSIRLFSKVRLALNANVRTYLLTYLLAYLRSVESENTEWTVYRCSTISTVGSTRTRIPSRSASYSSCRSPRNRSCRFCLRSPRKVCLATRQLFCYVIMCSQVTRNTCM